MRESQLLASIAARSANLAARFPHVRVGPGDDCAVLTLAGSTMLLKVDQLIEGRHFTPGTPLDRVAHKALARPISDVAAMGGSLEGGAALAAVVLPFGYPAERADALFDACAHAALSFNIPLVGGDIAVAGHLDSEHHAPGLILSITILAVAHPTRGPVLRSSAQPGDAVYVTGIIGGSYNPATGAGRHLSFSPRLPEAKALCDTLGERLHAMIDVSDGLGLDAARVANASNVSIEIDAHAIPLAPGVADPIAAARHGEDYELLFTAQGQVPASIAGTPVTRIGRVLPQGNAPPASMMFPSARCVDISGLGYDHGEAAGKRE